jgi:hypothetical protein
MNSSLLTAVRTTHIKVVAIGLSAALAIALFAFVVH